MRRSFVLVASMMLTGALGAQTAAPLSADTVVMDIPLKGQAEPLHVTLGQMMSTMNVPGVSIAIIDNNRIAWAGGIGQTAIQDGKPVTAGTLFQAASISKPVTAVGAMWLVSQGRLDLDQNVNDRLMQWKVPDNAFTTTQKVTLRRLLSHNAGINVHGFAGYERGKSLPTLGQILDGQGGANNDAFRVVLTPGTACRYSGGGYVIARALMEDVTHQPFTAFMQQRVLTPMGMKDSSFVTQLSPERAARAAQGTGRDGTPTPGQWHLYPELAPDSLWTTPSDLARFAIEIAQSYNGKANHVLSQKAVQEMLTPQCSSDDDRVGLGFGLRTPQGPALFGHLGSNDGFQSLMWMSATTGKGVVAMGNSDAFNSVGNAIMRTVARQYAWTAPAGQVDLGDALQMVASLRGADTALAAYDQAKAAGFAGYGHGPETLNLLGYGFMARRDLTSALRAFQLNVKEYPQDANAYDSLGEACMEAGDRDGAVRNYEHSLKLNPDNKNAVRRLETLRKGAKSGAH